MVIVNAPGASRSCAFGFTSMAALQSPPPRNDCAAATAPPSSPRRRGRRAAVPPLRRCPADDVTLRRATAHRHTAYLRLARHTGTPGPARPRLKVARSATAGGAGRRCALTGALPHAHRTRLGDVTGVGTSRRRPPPPLPPAINDGGINALLLPRSLASRGRAGLLVCCDVRVYSLSPLSSLSLSHNTPHAHTYSDGSRPGDAPRES